VFASSSGQTRALGTGGRQHAHRGRCVSCLVAGFYYALMPKIVRPTDSNENDIRVFTPEGDFVELERISEDLSVLLADIDEPVNDQYARSRTLGEIQTSSRGVQILEVYSLIYRHVNREYGDSLVAREISYRPTGLVSYISRVGRTREILSFERIDPDRWAYDAVARKEFIRTDGSTDPYWPVEDVLWWFGAVGDGLTPAKDNLAFGILQQNLGRLERGTFELAKAVISMGEDEYVPPYPHPGHTHHYFNTIMSQSVADIDDIDDDAVEAIKDVATSIGRVFHGGEDIGVLINLQNASTATEFLRAFEKASMQAQKQSVQEAPMPWDASKDDSVATVLKLIKNRSTFDPTKRMFVIHAALAAQYANVATDGPDNTQSEANGPDEGGE